jgi:phosphate transport system substrate-binding protein
MDLASTFGLFLAILTGVGIFASTLNNLIPRETDAGPKPTTPTPSGARQPRGRAVPFATLALLIAALGVQYVAAPQTSIFTYPFFPGIPFPGSTLAACHVQVSDLPLGVAKHAEPPLSETLSGQRLTLSGSSVLYSLFATAGKNFDLINNTSTTVNKLDSGQGLSDVAQGRTQIGLSDIYIQDDTDPNVQGATGLLDYQVAVAPFTMLVSSDLKDIVQNLTTQQIISIYGGKITNWRGVGGPDEPITVFNRRQGSGTRVTFEKYVLGISVPNDDLRAGTTQALITLMGRTRGAIGYAATPSVINSGAGKVFPICIDGYGATTANINRGVYLFWSYEHAYVKTLTEPDRAFLAFICGHDFQTEDVAGSGFLRSTQLSADAIATHLEDYPPPQQCA